MILPWLIGQAFVHVSPGAMMGLIFIGVLLNLLMLGIFTRISVGQNSVPESTGIAD